MAAAEADGDPPSPAPGHSVQLTLKFRGRVFHVQVPKQASLASLSETIHRATGVSRATQQLIGKRLSVKPDASGVRDALVGDVIGKDAETLTLSGQLSSDTASFERGLELQAKQRQPSAEYEELREARRRQYVHVQKRVDSSLFGSVAALNKGHGGRPLTNPTPASAQALLERLATDRGVVGIMRERGWRVGTLTEMLPDGKVGVDPVCVLGLNVNAGQKILLRLRTDDYRGLRRYQVIIDTLLHELAHNVHSNHGPDFRALNSQLQKDYRRLAEGALTGHVLDAGVRRDQGREGEEAPRPQEKPKVLGGDRNGGAVSAREAARQAALERFEDRGPEGGGVSHQSDNG